MFLDRHIWKLQGFYFGRQIGGKWKNKIESCHQILSLNFSNINNRTTSQNIVNLVRKKKKKKKNLYIKTSFQ